MISRCGHDWNRKQLAGDVKVLKRIIKKTVTGKKHKGACFCVTTNC